jgi:RTX calcium-binding nonapeptide repeat (4 copies)
VAIVAAASALIAPAASAIQIRQIHPSNGMFGGDWVELQMSADGQNQIGGKLIRTFFGDGTLSTSYTITGPAPSGQSQRTILISSVFTPAGVSADFVAAPSALHMTGQDGAACFTEADTTPIDCVAYGNFTGTLPVGQPAVATPFESTLQRKITSNCPTALDDADDTNNSAADFALTTDPPRNNSATPTEKTCAGKGGTKPPPGSNFKCDGQKVTLIGSAAKDSIKGTAKRDVIDALGGADTVNGGGGNDVLCGSAGKDTLRGGKGKDRLDGGKGKDLLVGGASKDILLGGAGKDVCKGGAAADTGKKCETEKTL